MYTDLCNNSAKVMEEDNKLPLKRVELSLSKFNEVAIPHHLDLLRQHKANIVKYCARGEWRRVLREQSAARRAAARLRALLAELDALRRSVRAADRAAFDALTQRTRTHTQAAVADFLDVIASGRTELGHTPALHRHESAPVAVPVGADREGAGAEAVSASLTSTESVGVVRGEGEDETEVVPLQLQVGLTEVAEREEALRGWEELQAEVCALRDAWQAVHAAALAQRAHAEHAERAVDAAAEDVAAARAQLAGAARLRGGALLAGGAALGALAGGPLGLLVGAKAGAVAALAGSLLGYTTARLLGRPAPAPAAAPAPAPAPDKDKDA